MPTFEDLAKRLCETCNTQKPLTAFEHAAMTCRDCGGTTPFEDADDNETED